MAITQGDPEAELFELSVENVLKAAGWQQLPWKGFGFTRSRNGGVSLGEFTTQNVLILIYKNWIDQLRPASDTLVQALQAAGISVSTASDVWVNDGESANPLAKDNIHVIVGRKLP